MSHPLHSPAPLLILSLLFAISITQVSDLQQAQALPAAGAGEHAIAYVSPSRDNQQIRLVNPNGSNDRLLWQVTPDTDRQQGIGELSWRSDASELAFDSAHDWHRSINIRDIYSIAPDGTQLRRLTRPPAAFATNHFPMGTVAFTLDSYITGDAELYIEGANAPIDFFTKSGESYPMTQTVADLGDDVRQYIRLMSSNRCYYNDAGWVDVIPNQLTDIGRVEFRFGNLNTCPLLFRPAWMYNRNELLYLFAQPNLPAVVQAGLDV